MAPVNAEDQADWSSSALDRFDDQPAPHHGDVGCPPVECFDEVLGNDNGTLEKVLHALARDLYERGGIDVAGCATG